VIKLKVTWGSTTSPDGYPVVFVEGETDYPGAKWCQNQDMAELTAENRDTFVFCVEPKDEAQRQAILADSRFTIVES